MGTINVVLADDHDIIRYGIKALLSDVDEEDGLRVFGMGSEHARVPSTGRRVPAGQASGSVRKRARPSSAV